MSKSNASETKKKLYKLRLALEYAKKENNELKIINLKEDIKEVRDRLKKEEMDKIRKGR